MKVVSEVQPKNLFRATFESIINRSTIFVNNNVKIDHEFCSWTPSMEKTNQLTTSRGRAPPNNSFLHQSKIPSVIAYKQKAPTTLWKILKSHGKKRIASKFCDMEILKSHGKKRIASKFCEMEMHMGQRMSSTKPNIGIITFRLDTLGWDSSSAHVWVELKEIISSTSTKKKIIIQNSLNI
jgi:hypothetical protein